MLEWSSIDTVLLDMDGTLLDLHFDNYFWQIHLTRRYAELHKLPYEQAEQFLIPKIAALTGTLNWYCLDYWSRELQVDIVQLKHEINHLIAIHPYAEDFLHKLQGRKQLYLVTNAHRKSLELKLERTGIDRFFNGLISAHDYQQPKEQPAFWQQLQQQLGFEPARTLLVEDNVSILKTAHHFGIAHLLAITKPDSNAAVRSVDGFPAVENFGELLPGLD